MTAAKRPNAVSQSSWWSRRRNRNRVWLVLIVALIVLAGVLLLQTSGRGGGGSSVSASRQPALYTFETDDIHALTFVPEREGELLFGHHGGILSSSDGGENWQAQPANFDAMNIVFDPTAPTVAFVAGHNVLSKSMDGGKTWSTASNDLPGLDLHGFGAGQEPGHFYAYAAGHGLYKTETGSSWTLVSGSVPQGTHSIIELPGGVLLLGAADEGILRSEDGGQTWAQSRLGIESGVIFTIKGDPEGTRLYAGTSTGLFTTTDGGRSWTETTLDDTVVVSVAVDPADPQLVMAVGRDGSLYRSEDGGATWGR